MILSRDWDLQLEKVYNRQDFEEPGKWLGQDEKEAKVCSEFMDRLKLSLSDH